jgi:UDP-2-acetamido-3-amino-2,3-dideoxy-glucuronate N-acetyltransferase
MPPSDAIFVHPNALCESDDIGAGTRIWAFAHVMKGAIVGGNCNIGDHAFIESGARLGHRVTIKNQVMVWDGVEIGDDVFVGPGTTFTNDLWPRSPRMALAPVADRYREREHWLERISVAAGASLGARCIILPGVTIGAFAMVGAGAVVTRDVAPHALVIGHPARAMGWVCRCGFRLVRLGAGIWKCPSCGERHNEESFGPCTNLARSSS